MEQILKQGRIEVEKEKQKQEMLTQKYENDKEDLTELFKRDQVNSNMVQEKQRSALTDQLNSAKHTIEMLTNEKEQLKNESRRTRDAFETELIRKNEESENLKRALIDRELVFHSKFSLFYDISLERKKTSAFTFSNINFNEKTEILYLFYIQFYIFASMAFELPQKTVQNLSNFNHDTQTWLLSINNFLKWRIIFCMIWWVPA